MVSANVLTIDDSNFENEVLKSTLPFCLEFWATWCGPSKYTEPITSSLADEMLGKVRFGRLDIDASPATTKIYSVASIPTFIIFKGGAVSGRVTTTLNNTAYRNFIAKYA